MPTYIALMRLTEEGAEEIKEAPERIREAVQKLEVMGGKLVAFYATMGQYDYVGIAEAPSDEVAMTFLLGLNAQGNVKTITLKAFTVQEFATILSRLT